jgi:hypothetical protein
VTAGADSVAECGVDLVEQWLAGNEAAQIVGE